MLSVKWARAVTAGRQFFLNRYIGILLNIGWTRFVKQSFANPVHNMPIEVFRHSFANPVPKRNANGQLHRSIKLQASTKLLILPSQPGKPPPPAPAPDKRLHLLVYLLSTKSYTGKTCSTLPPGTKPRFWQTVPTWSNGSA